MAARRCRRPTRRRWTRLRGWGRGPGEQCPQSLPAGCDVASLSLLGYDPLANFTGRAPLEAAAQGIQLGRNDWAIRCNLVTIENQTMRELYGRSHFDRRSERAACHGAGARLAG